MRYRTLGLTLAGFAAFILAACGGGGGGSVVPPPPPPNVAPTANAGTAQTVTSGVTVTLDGTASTDSDGTIAGYAWTQTAGAAVTLTGPVTSQPTFPAPQVVAAETLTFSLIVTDNRAAASTAATVNVTVNPPVAGNTNVFGRVTFARIPVTGNGLNYSAPAQRPSRGVLVHAVNPTTQVVLASASTDDDGDYTMVLANNLDIRVVVVAQMLRTGALPNWDIRAADFDVGVDPYTYADGVTFNSSTGTAHDIAIPSGLSAAGVATGTRASAPFAVLDTVYQGVQLILSAAPTNNFPTLILDWATDNLAGETFFTPGAAGVPQHIVLSAELDNDTDEFDQHVIAHEFGHYIEYNFSRADNIGGSHGLGDKLDARVAFGEGFGYAFAGMVLNDPVARDTFVDGNGIQRASTFDIETNPPSNPVLAINGNYGCWCSESSVWSILWDLYDVPADPSDTLSLGFEPLWNVLVNPQRNTPAFTTIFSFITALKVANGGSAGAIDTLVAAQNIDSVNMDAFGTNETHTPTNVPALASLPVHTLGTLGGPQLALRSVDNAGHYNKLGNHRFVRFNVPNARNVTITAASNNPNNPDTDFLVYKAGVFIAAGVDGPAPTETETFQAAAGDYLLDVYDCANGCNTPDDTPEGTPGDYDLTVTIN